MGRTVGLTALTFVAAVAGWAAGRWLPAAGPTPAGTTSTHAGPTVEQVRELAELVTLRVDVADVQTTAVAGYLGGLRVALIVRGDVTLGVDLAAARFEAVDGAARTAVLVLPAVRAAGPRVDHDRTRVVAVTDEGLWAVVPGDGGARGRAVGQAYAEAQRTVAAVAADPALSDRARWQAERVVAAFFRAAGWAVRVRWEE